MYPAGFIPKNCETVPLSEVYESALDFPPPKCFVYRFFGDFFDLQSEFAHEGG